MQKLPARGYRSRAYRNPVGVEPDRPGGLPHLHTDGDGTAEAGRRRVEGQLHAVTGGRDVLHLSKPQFGRPAGSEHKAAGNGGGRETKREVAHL